MDSIAGNLNIAQYFSKIKEQAPSLQNIPLCESDEFDSYIALRW